MNKLKNKAGDWLLKSHEDRLRRFLVPKVPGWLETYHLTLLTLVWSGLILAFFYLGRADSSYLLLIPLLVVLQYITDLLDGAVGRSRNTGLVKWGYYADHFLDFVFVSSIIAGYAIILGFNVWIFALYAIISGFHVSTYLLVSADDGFRISFLRIGPTEARIIFIIFHLIISYRDIYILDLLLPYLVAIAALALTILFLINQNALWKKDLLYTKPTKKI